MKFVVAIALFLLGCWLLAYGTAMVLFVPGALGHTLDRSFVVYGLLPILLSFALFVWIGCLAARWRHARLTGSIAVTISFGISAVVLVYFVLGVVSALRQHS